MAVVLIPESSSLSISPNSAAGETIKLYALDANPLALAGQSTAFVIDDENVRPLFRSFNEPQMNKEKRR